MEAKPTQHNQGPQDPRSGGQGPVTGLGDKAREAQERTSLAEEFEVDEAGSPEGAALHITSDPEAVGIAYDDNEGLD